MPSKCVNKRQAVPPSLSSRYRELLPSRWRHIIPGKDRYLPLRCECRDDTLAVEIRMGDRLLKQSVGNLYLSLQIWLMKVLLTFGLLRALNGELSSKRGGLSLVALRVIKKGT